MRVYLLIVATLSLAACTTQAQRNATDTPSTECAVYIHSGVLKGTLERTVNPDGTLTYIFK